MVSLSLFAQEKGTRMDNWRSTMGRPVDVTKETGVGINLKSSSGGGATGANRRWVVTSAAFEMSITTRRDSIRKMI